MLCQETQRHPLLREIIELSLSVEDADEMLSSQPGFDSVKSKLDYLTEEFGYECLSYDAPNTPDYIREYNDYVAMLAAIIDDKWR